MEYILFNYPYVARKKILYIEYICIYIYNLVYVYRKKIRIS